jgi:hypothetical protein
MARLGHCQSDGSVQPTGKLPARPARAVVRPGKTNAPLNRMASQRPRHAVYPAWARPLPGL